MDTERRQLPDSEGLRIPEPDPSCPNCRRLAEFARGALDLLGEVREEIRRTNQQISDLRAETEELRRMGSMLTSGFKAISERPPVGGVPKTPPVRPGRRGSAARRKKSRKKRS